MNADPSSLEGTTRVPALDWPLLARLPALLAEGQYSAASCRTLLAQGQQELQDRFTADEPVEGLVRARATFTDHLLGDLWTARLDAPLAARLALAAVGGYGRGELHPHSDVDILVLVPSPLAEDERGQVERLVAFLWDIGLEVGHSVRTIDDCQHESLADISVATTLLEARLLAGPEPLFAGMKRALAPDRIWSATEFYEGKVRGQGAVRELCTTRQDRYRLQVFGDPTAFVAELGLEGVRVLAWEDDVTGKEAVRARVETHSHFPLRRLGSGGVASVSPVCSLLSFARHACSRHD